VLQYCNIAIEDKCSAERVRGGFSLASRVHFLVLPKRLCDGTRRPARATVNGHPLLVLVLVVVVVLLLLVAAAATAATILAACAAAGQPPQPSHRRRRRCRRRRHNGGAQRPHLERVTAWRPRVSEFQ
jgi:hypothetical protein